MLFETNKTHNNHSEPVGEKTLPDSYNDQPQLFPAEPSDLCSFDEKGIEGVNELESITEPAIVLNSIWVTQENGEQLHLKHFLPQQSQVLISDAESQPGFGRRVFMLHGEAESGRVFYDSNSKGLAWYLARQGYEVFVADLGGRGRSLAPEGEFSTLSVDQIISSAIPRLLQAIANTPLNRGADACFGYGADIWVAHGFGTVMLTAAWARLPEYLRAAQQMVFFSGRRKVISRRKLSRLFLSALGHPLMRKWVAKCNRFPARKLGLGSANESVGWYLNYLNWMNSDKWLSDDGFDYARSMLRQPLPPILHLAAQRDGVYANLRDVRAFIEELGPHDARLLIYDGIGESNRHYNHLSMLLDGSAPDDIFSELSSWLMRGVDRASTDWLDYNATVGRNNRHINLNQEATAESVNMPSSGVLFA
mgnify:CR=1 FL=1